MATSRRPDGVTDQPFTDSRTPSPTGARPWEAAPGDAPVTMAQLQMLLGQLGAPALSEERAGSRRSSGIIGSRRVTPRLQISARRGRGSACGKDGPGCTKSKCSSCTDC